MLDINVAAISTTVALKAECACVGCSSPNPRAHRDRGRGEGWVEDEPVTGVDFIVAQRLLTVRGIRFDTRMLSACGFSLA